MGKEQTERRTYWQVDIGEQKVSGKSVRDFCRGAGVRRAFVLLTAPPLARGEASFVRIGGDQAGGTGSQFELTVGSGEVLGVPPDVESLRIVFEALRAAR